ncbi:site-specific integrase [Galbibacter sp. EGI 63066]|uniref:site-specific integrase n=1 Tax=Galbibacter sp. EGI 63066 TaxID=2993559 RepID=UPI002248B9A7|nr:site-specific integrase [Galbibacter sp. EGI 63066]MCX2678906.1 site-specific integrase [Galbibacter sp. EGI 63066]
MASIKTVLRKKKLTDGTYPVCLRVTKDRKTKYFKTIYNALPKHWDNATGTFNKGYNNYIQSNRLLLKIKARALKTYSDLEIEKDHFTLEDFERQFRVESNPVKLSVFSFWNEIINEMITAGRTGNARANRDTYNSVKLFLNSTSLFFQEITPTFLNKYEVFLRSRGGTDGGIGVRMRAIRALYNMAIERKVVKRSYYPFNSYKISKLKGKGIKKALNIDEIQRIINMDISKHPDLIDTRNYFLFSFYTRGMNFADMMKLRWSNISGDKIFYIRSKTKGKFTIKILPPVREILDYYCQVNKTQYVFPILLKDNMTPSQIENRKSKTLKKYNKDLKEIAKICKIEKPITSYVARHTFANCLKQKGVATDVISESMGHQNVSITQVYLKELDSSVLDEACELLL